MDEEVIEKYRSGGGGDGGYRLVYKSEGKDDPFGDMDFTYAEELSDEIAINMVGEVTMATTVMEDEIEKILDDYGAGDEPVSSAVYLDQAHLDKAGYRSTLIEREEDEEEEPREN